MRYLFLTITVILFYSCKDSNVFKSFPLTDYDTEVRMSRTSMEFEQFEKQVIDLYKQSITNPEKVIEWTDTLIVKIQIDPDSNNIKLNKLESLSSLRAEVFYKIGKYQESIVEVMKGLDSNQRVYAGLTEQDNLVLACNYVKLKDFAKAKSLIDSANNGYYITDYMLGNFYEVVRDQKAALNVYNGIKKNEFRGDTFFYKLVLEREEELNKPNPNFLNELSYPTENPGLEFGR